MSSTTQVIVPAGSWTLDRAHSTVAFTVLYMGVAPYTGTFRSVHATLDADGLRGVAEAASIDVDVDGLAEHLRSPDFFDVASHPDLRFDGTTISGTAEALAVDGSLTIKGVTRPATLTGTIAGPVEDPSGGSRVALRLATTVNRQDFGISWNAPLPAGGSILADEVEISASLLFVLDPEA